MEVKKKIRVDVLNWDDAWCLFKEMVTEETIDSDPLIQRYAVDIVMELGRLPLALITIGRAMHDKMDPREWEHAVKLLKQCFLHCALWPEDYHIQRDDLIELWMGLGLIDEPKIQEAYDVGHRYIGRLLAVCLLEIGDDYGGTIKMHDVIRDMAIWITSNQGEYTNKWITPSDSDKRRGVYEIEVSGDTEILFMKSKFADVSISVTCSSAKLSTLLFNGNFIKDPKNLRLELFSKLTFLDLSSNSFEVFPVEICKLVHLQFLNLSGNSFRNILLPEEIGDLTNLKYLLLCHTICAFPNKVLSKLKALRVLDLRYFSLVESFQNFLVLLQEELQCLPDFQALGISIPNSSTLDFHELSQKVSVPIRWLEVGSCTESCLLFLNCYQWNSQMENSLISIVICDMDDVEYVKFESISENQIDCRLGRLETLEFQRMKNIKEVIWKSLDPKDVFPRLQCVNFSFCIELTSISWVVNLPCIRELSIHNCGSIKQLILIDEQKNSGVKLSRDSFPFLKKIFLLSNGKLERISDPTITFPALEFLFVLNCNNLKELPFIPSNPPTKLKWIQGVEEWWNNIEMEDGDYKSSLQPFFKKHN